MKGEHGLDLWLRGAAVAAVLAVGGSPAQAGPACVALRSLSLPHAIVTAAESLPAGRFTPPGESTRDRVTYLPAICRVAATLTPSSDSDIRIEVWLPETGWNGKYQAVGNGGWAGSISYTAMGEAIRRGYATSSTDTGHVGGNGAFVYGHPEKLTDFAYRAVHEMTVSAKRVLEAFYGAPPRFSYWNGCSAGGRQGLKEAERFPTDYDGIIAGDAANPSPLLNTWQLHVAQIAHASPDAYIPPEKYASIHRAVLAACDADDGLKDGLLHDPLRCRFDPAVLACAAGTETPSCLTAPQVDTARALLAPLVEPFSGTTLAPGIQLGSELEWGSVAGPEPSTIAVDYFKYVVHDDPEWQWKTLRFGASLQRAQTADDGLIEARPEVAAFASRGGKLLMYHGWSDARVPPRFSIDYYEQTVGALGHHATDAVALFLVPGMGHCRGGDGYNTFDLVGALEAWVERGQTPTAIPASRVTGGRVERAGPLCAYPRVPRHTGAPDAVEASFACGAP